MDILILDYDMGNVDSISRILEDCGANPIISRDLKDFNSSSAIILPGVGSFSEAMNNIHKYGLAEILTKEVIQKRKPLLGICLGMQILATYGTEGGRINGLGFIEGEVIRFQPEDPQIRIPHVGWNNVYFSNHPLFEGIPSGTDFYFVHSYHFVCKDPQTILARTPYCGEFTSAIGKDTIFGTQFHPEKSQKNGRRLLQNFLKLAVN